MSASANFVPSGSQRYLRACMVCSVVMTYTVSFPPLFYGDPCAARQIQKRKKKKKTRVEEKMQGAWMLDTNRAGGVLDSGNRKLVANGHLGSASATKDAPTAKSSCTSPAHRTRLRAARRRSLKGSSRSPTRPSRGSPSGSASTATSPASTPSRYRASCLTRCGRRSRTSIEYSTFRMFFVDAPPPFGVSIQAG